MTRAHDTPNFYRENLLERIRAAEAEIRKHTKRTAGLEVEARAQDRRLERLKARAGGG